MEDYLCHAPSVIHSITMSMVNIVLLIAALQAGMMAQQGQPPGGILVGFHINILDVHCFSTKSKIFMDVGWHMCMHSCMQTYT